MLAPPKKSKGCLREARSGNLPRQAPPQKSKGCLRKARPGNLPCQAPRRNSKAASGKPGQQICHARPPPGNPKAASRKPGQKICQPLPEKHRLNCSRRQHLQRPFAKQCRPMPMLAATWQGLDATIVEFRPAGRPASRPVSRPASRPASEISSNLVEIRQTSASRPAGLASRPGVRNFVEFRRISSNFVEFSSNFRRGFR